MLYKIWILIYFKSYAIYNILYITTILNQNGGQMSEETQVANETVVDNATPKPEMSTPDNSELIAESKKYRKRSQSAEARVAELEAKINSFEDQRLKEKEDFKTLYEKVSIENEQNGAKAKEWDDYQAKKREEILSNIPEEERGDYDGVKLKSLEKIISKITTPKTVNPDHVSNAPKGVGEFGGYSSYAEWATKDPKGYEEANGIIGRGTTNLSGF